MHELSMDLNVVLRDAVALGASDIHFKVGQPPVFRFDGELSPADEFEPLREADLHVILEDVTITTPHRRQLFDETGELDVAYAYPSLPRFRVNGFRQRGSISFAFRVIPTKIAGFHELNLPKGVSRLAEENRGLILVTGATGSGKTTTLAAMLDEINRTRRLHIVTIEDPIEILHSDQCSIVNQREVGLDTESFQQASRRVLRQDPDVILIGELRDADSALVALQAAESGHLVFSTLHTIDAAETLNRLIEFFPEAKHKQIRSVLAGTLRGVISQRLLPRAHGGRVPAVEVMVVNARIRDLIRENRPDEITDAINEGEYYDMQTFQTSLIKLVLQGEVEREVATNAATSEHDFTVALEHALKAQKVREATPETEPEEKEERNVRPLVPGAGQLRTADPGEAASARG
jgi:twitching motility protein PilT